MGIHNLGILIFSVLLAFSNAQEGDRNCNGKEFMCVEHLQYLTCADRGDGQFVIVDDIEQSCPDGTYCSNSDTTPCASIIPSEPPTSTAPTSTSDPATTAKEELGQTESVGKDIAVTVATNDDAKNIDAISVMTEEDTPSSEVSSSIVIEISTEGVKEIINENLSNPPVEIRESEETLVVEENELPVQPTENFSSGLEEAAIASTTEGNIAPVIDEIASSIAVELEQVVDGVSVELTNDALEVGNGNEKGESNVAQQVEQSKNEDNMENSGNNISEFEDVHDVTQAEGNISEELDNGASDSANNISMEEKEEFHGLNSAGESSDRNSENSETAGLAVVEDMPIESDDSLILDSSTVASLPEVDKSDIGSGLSGEKGDDGAITVSERLENSEDNIEENGEETLAETTTIENLSVGNEDLMEQNGNATLAETTKTIENSSTDSEYSKVENDIEVLTTDIPLESSAEESATLREVEENSEADVNVQNYEGKLVVAEASEHIETTNAEENNAEKSSQVENGEVTIEINVQQPDESGQLENNDENIVSQGTFGEEAEMGENTTQHNEGTSHGSSMENDSTYGSLTSGEKVDETTLSENEIKSEKNTVEVTLDENGASSSLVENNDENTVSPAETLSSESGSDIAQQESTETEGGNDPVETTITEVTESAISSSTNKCEDCQASAENIATGNVEGSTSEADESDNDVEVSSNGSATEVVVEASSLSPSGISETEENKAVEESTSASAVDNSLESTSESNISESTENAENPTVNENTVDETAEGLSGATGENNPGKNENVPDETPEGSAGEASQTDANTASNAISGEITESSSSVTNPTENGETPTFEENRTEQSTELSSSTATVSDVTGPTTTTLPPCIAPGPHPYEGDCRRYFVCLGSPLGYYRVEAMCPPRFAYSERLLRCTRDLTACGGPKCTESGNIADPEDPTKYFWCVMSISGGYHKYQIQCAKYKKFIPETGTCDYDFESLLGNSQESDSSDEMEDEDSILKTEKSWLKQQEKRLAKELKQREKEEKQLQKEHEKEEKRKKKEEEKERKRAEKMQRKLLSTDVDDSKEDLTKTPAFECTEEGTFSDPSSCEKYFICWFKKPEILKKTHMKCPLGFMFNSEQKICSDDPAVKCP